MRLPAALAHLFRNYVFDTLDDQRHAGLVIRTVLAYGEWEEILWLFRHYGREKVKQVFLDDYYGLRSLPAATRSLWETLFVPDSLTPAKKAGGSAPSTRVERWRVRRRSGEGGFLNFISGLDGGEGLN